MMLPPNVFEERSPEEQRVYVKWARGVCVFYFLCAAIGLVAHAADHFWRARTAVASEKSAPLQLGGSSSPKAVAQRHR